MESARNQTNRANYGQNKIALFKGLYIEEFLKIEYALEQIIMKFFKEYPTINILFGEQENKLQELKSDVRNLYYKAFFEHFLFIDSGFTFNTKLESVKTIIQLLNGNYYKTITQKGKNIFSLIQLLN